MACNTFYIPTTSRWRRYMSCQSTLCWYPSKSTRSVCIWTFIFTYLELYIHNHNKAQKGKGSELLWPGFNSKLGIRVPKASPARYLKAIVLLYTVGFVTIREFFLFSKHLNQFKVIQYHCHHPITKQFLSTNSIHFPFCSYYWQINWYNYIFFDTVLKKTWHLSYQMFISVSILDLFCLLPYLLGGATETNAAQAPCVRSMPSRNSWSLQSLPCLFGKLRCRKVAIGRLLGEFVDFELP